MKQELPTAPNLPINEQLLIKQMQFRQQQAEIEEWKRKYKDMHNLATQAMSRVHELEKAQEK